MVLVSWLFRVKWWRKNIHPPSVQQLNCLRRILARLNWHYYFYLGFLKRILLSAALVPSIVSLGSYIQLSIYLFQAFHLMIGQKTFLVISNCTCTPQWSVPSTSKAWISLAIITLSMWTITSDFSHWEHQFTRCSPSPHTFLIKGSKGYHVNSPDLRGSPQDFVFPAHSCGER